MSCAFLVSVCNLKPGLNFLGHPWKVISLLMLGVGFGVIFACTHLAEVTTVVVVGSQVVLDHEMKAAYITARAEY
jgi:hypothetical protein